jgi:hypothetical protein
MQTELNFQESLPLPQAGAPSAQRIFLWLNLSFWPNKKKG